MDMSKLAGFVGMTVGGAVGWYAGAFFGFMTAFVLSCVGSGVGLYVARRGMQQYLILILGIGLVSAPVVQGQTPSPGAIKAAGELMQVRREDKLLHDQMVAVFDAQVQSNPAMAPYRGTMQAFVDKYVTWDAISPQLTTLYAQTFTESELRDLIAFYKTPTGQKVVSQQSVLGAKSQQIIISIVQAHQAELADMIRQQQGGATKPADTTQH
jgi:hypothetical protein